MDDRAEHPAVAGTAGLPTVLGEYQLGTHFTRHAAADVYDATHVTTGEARRVYVLRPTAMQDNAFVHRVVCEADAARWIRHPAAAKLEGYGETPSRRLFVAVERPAGRPLGEVIAGAGRLAPSRVVRIAGRLVEALAEAHAVGLVHGRLTPGVVVVADDAHGAEPGASPAVTLTGLGTCAIDARDPLSNDDGAYVSPEQRDGGEADVRSDVFGLASLLHHALTGAAPVGGADAEPADGRAAASAPAVHAVLAAARSVDPRGRPETVKAFWEDLLEALVVDVARANRAAENAPAGAAAAWSDLTSDHGIALADLELAEFAPAALEPDAEAQAADDPAASVIEFSGVALTAPPARAEAPRRPVSVPWADASGTRAPRPGSVMRSATHLAGGDEGRGLRRYLAHAWWLAVPAAAAAALGWPIGRKPALAAPAPASAAQMAVAVEPAPVRVTTPRMLETVTVAPAAPIQAAALPAAARALQRRDADASGVADEAGSASPRTPRIDMPNIYILQAPEAVRPASTTRTLVRPEEFDTRIKIPGAPQ
jgi:serine/threonine-protein kinase